MKEIEIEEEEVIFLGVIDFPAKSARTHRSPCEAGQPSSQAKESASLPITITDVQFTALQAWLKLFPTAALHADLSVALSFSGYMYEKDLPDKMSKAGFALSSIFSVRIGVRMHLKSLVDFIMKRERRES